MARSTTKSPHSPHPSIRHAQAIVSNMEARTGRSFDEWVKLASTKSPADERARAQWLKDAHGLGANHAAWIVEDA